MAPREMAAGPACAPATTGSPSRSLSPEDENLRTLPIAKLREADGNVTQVGRGMGKARSQIQRWMRRLQIDLGKLDS